MGKIDEKKKIKQEALLSSAYELFTEKGANKTSISEIVENAGVAKGTFYLYFKDKYDLRNKLIAYKSGVVIGQAIKAMQHKTFEGFTQEILFLVDHIIGQFRADLSLLEFISKNLSWKIFRSALLTETKGDGAKFQDIYLQIIQRRHLHFERPEIMLYLIVEVINSVCYNSILFNDPVDIDAMKPYLYRTVASIIENHRLEQ